MTHQATPFEQEHSFGRVIDVLEAIGAVYAIWGGLAVVAYGEPRFTLDMDILLSPTGFLTGLFVKRLTESNYHVDQIAVEKALLGGGYFNVIDLQTFIKTDFFVPQQDYLLNQALRERVYLPFNEIRQAAYISVTAAIVTKLRAYTNSQSTRHLDDIGSIIRVQGNRVQAADVENVATQLNVLPLWQQLWQTNFPHS